jgi:hypothetical protein
VSSDAVQNLAVNKGRTELDIRDGVVAMAWCRCIGVGPPSYDDQLQNERSDGHGRHFMGVYVRLIERHRWLERQILVESLQDAGVEIARDSCPVFVDT